MYTIIAKLAKSSKKLLKLTLTKLDKTIGTYSFSVKGILTFFRPCAKKTIL
jgi:hypothetical protein